jgi:protein-L-isoaspartate(D-aspartate) O-methyltransferase
LSRPVCATQPDLADTGTLIQAIQFSWRQAGPNGRVIAIEVDADLAARSRGNLVGLPNVEVVDGDGGEHDSGPADAILVNAGATHPRRIWLDSLRPNGRLVHLIDQQAL